jgi:hypothetical protein
MPVIPILPQRSARLGACCALATLPFWFAACTSTKIEGVPDKLPEIALSGSTATPPHNMATYEYPFDSNGNYVSDWAAEGERRAGRSARATSDDERKWSSSQGGRTISKSKAKSKSKTKSTSPTKSKSTSSTRYVVKKGDTVGKIAQRYGITSSKLKSANGLKSDFIRAGQTLKIPK